MTNNDWIDAYKEYAEIRHQEIANEAEHQLRARHLRDIAYARSDAANQAVTIMACHESKIKMQFALEGLISTRRQNIVEELYSKYPSLPDASIYLHAEEMLNRSIPTARFEQSFVKDRRGDMVVLSFPSLHYRFVVND